MKNKYIKVAKISESKFRLIVKCFANDILATQTANLTGINRNTILYITDGLVDIGYDKHLECITVRISLFELNLISMELNLSGVMLKFKIS